MIDPQTESLGEADMTNSSPASHPVFPTLAALLAACGLAFLAANMASVEVSWILLAISTVFAIMLAAILSQERTAMRSGRAIKMLARSVNVSKHLQATTRAPERASIQDDAMEGYRIESGNTGLVIRPFSILALVDNSVSGFQRSKPSNSVEIKIRIAPDVPRNVLGDRDRLTQMIESLLKNANRLGAQGLVKFAVDLDWQENRGNTVRFAIKATRAKAGLETTAANASPFAAPTTSDVGETKCEIALRKEFAERMGGDIGECDDPVGAEIFFRVVLPPARGGRSVSEGNTAIGCQPTPARDGQHWNINWVSMPPPSSAATQRVIR